MHLYIKVILKYSALSHLHIAASGGGTFVADIDGGPVGSRRVRVEKSLIANS